MKGHFIATIRGRKMKNREGVFEQFAAVLQFPEYFGENWNAFLDCITDLDWLRADGFVIVIYDSESLLADGDDGEFRLFVARLSDAAQSFSQANEFRPATPFHLILHVAPLRAPLLRRRLQHASSSIPPISLPAHE